MASSHDFNLSCTLLLGHEGGYSKDPEDAGNWTGGTVGAGELKGTKYGISAAAYPNVDIANLTMVQAKAIYYSDYWRPAGCVDMSSRLAYVVFDAAVNNGVKRAVEWLQGAVGAKVDGIYGPATAAHLAEAITLDPSDMLIAEEVHAQRVYFMAGLSTWSTYGKGWSRRLAAVPLEAGVYWPTPTVVA